MEIRKEDITLLLFVDNIIKYLENPRESTKKLLFSEMTGFKLSTQVRKLPAHKYSRSAPWISLVCILLGAHVAIPLGWVPTSRIPGSEASCVLHLIDTARWPSGTAVPADTPTSVLVSVCHVPRECASATWGLNRERGWHGIQEAGILTQDCGERNSQDVWQVGARWCEAVGRRLPGN